MINIFRNQLNSQYFLCYYLYENKLQHVCRPCGITPPPHTHNQVFVYKTSSKIVSSSILMSCTPCRRSEYAMGTVRFEINVNV